MSNLPWLNTVQIRTMADFPAAVAWVITLLANTIYLITEDISTTDRFVMSNWTLLTGNNILWPQLEYTWTWDMFTSTNVSYSVVDIRLNCPNWRIINFTNDWTDIIIMDGVRVANCDEIGLFDNPLTLQITNCAFSSVITSWITVTWANILIQNLDRIFISSATDWFKMLDIGSSVSTNIEYSNLFFLSTAAWTAAIWISWVASSANLPAWAVATVRDSSFVWNITPLENITESDIRWDFKANSANVEDTKSDAWMAIDGAVTVTITSIWVPVIVNDANTGETDAWSLSNANKFEFSASLGRMTYKWEKPIHLQCIATATVEKSAGWSDTLCWYLAKNWAVITNSKACTQNNAPTSITVQAWLDLVLDDYIEFAVENNSTTWDILLDLSNLEIF